LDVVLHPASLEIGC